MYSFSFLLGTAERSPLLCFFSLLCLQNLCLVFHTLISLNFHRTKSPDTRIRFIWLRISATRWDCPHLKMLHRQCFVKILRLNVWTLHACVVCGTCACGRLGVSNLFYIPFKRISMLKLSEIRHFYKREDSFPNIIILSRLLYVLHIKRI